MTRWILFGVILGIEWVLVVAVLNAALRSWTGKVRLDGSPVADGVKCPECSSTDTWEVTIFGEDRHRWSCAACGARFDGEPIH